MAFESVLMTVFVGGGMLLLVGVVFASIWGFARWHGVWRVLALLPFAGALFVGGRIVLDTRRDPTSHNLWPLEVLVTAVVGLFALAVLYVGQRAGGTHHGTP
jgi:hypothetical protein